MRYLLQVGEIWYTMDGQCYDEMNHGLWIVLLNALMRTENGNWPAMPELAAAASSAQEAAAQPASDRRQMSEATQPAPDGRQASAAPDDVVINGTGDMVDQAVSQQSMGLPEAAGIAQQAAAEASAQVSAGDADAAFHVISARIERTAL